MLTSFQTFLMFTSDFKEFAQPVRSIHVKFLIMGGYAQAVFEHSRFINDSSFWLDTNFGNGEKIVNTMTEAGLGWSSLTARDLKINKAVARQPIGLADLGSLR